MPRFMVAHNNVDQGEIYGASASGGIELVMRLQDIDEAVAVAAELERQYLLGVDDGRGTPAQSPDAGPVPRDAPHPDCPVVLRGEGVPALVGGVELPTVIGGAYRALAYLARIYPAGISRAALSDAIGLSDASGPLGSLVKRDARWSACLVLPRRQGEFAGPANTYCIRPLPEGWGVPPASAPAGETAEAPQGD